MTMMVTTTKVVITI